MPPKIDYKKCNGSLKCVEVCPVNVFDKKNGKGFVARPADCIECRACEYACPVQAIKVE